MILQLIVFAKLLMVVYNSFWIKLLEEEESTDFSAKLTYSLGILVDEACRLSRNSLDFLQSYTNLMGLSKVDYFSLKCSCACFNYLKAVGLKFSSFLHLLA